MTRQLEQMREEKQKKRDFALLYALEGGLAEAVGRSGADLVGVTFSFRRGDCLATVKGLLAGRNQIAFIGASDLAECVLKIVREAKHDRLQWREDKYAKG